MKYLNIKLFRDIRNNWAQFFSVFLMAFLCVLVFMGLQGAWGGLGKSLDDFTGKNNLADGWVLSTGIDDEQTNELRQIKGISDLQLKTRISTENTTKKNSIISLDTFSKNNISQFTIYKGQNLNQHKIGELVLNKEYADQNNYTVGDVVELKDGFGKKAKLKLCGLIQSPEKIYYTGTQEFIAPNYKDYGYGFITQDTLEKEFNYHFSPNLIEFKGESRDYRRDFEEVLGNKYISYFSQNTLNDVANALERVGQIRNLSYLFSSLFILLAVLAMYTTIKRLIETQMKEVAVLKALGISNLKIGIHYGSFGFIIGGLGAILGAICAPLISWFVLSTQKDMFSLPEWRVSYGFSSLFIIFFVIAISTVSAFSASKSARKSLPSAFLSSGNVKKVKHIFLEKLPFWDKIKFGNRWALRDAMINRARFFMGVIGVAGGMMLLIAGFGMPESINTLVDKAYNDDFTYDRRIYTPDYDEISSSDDGQWVQLSSAHFYPDDGFNRLLIVISDGEYVNMKTEDGEEIKNDGIYVTEGFANRAKINKDDLISLRTGLDEKKYTFKVAGIITSETNQGAYIMQNLWEREGGTFSPSILLVGKQTKLPTISGLKTINETIKISDQKKNAYEFVNSLVSIFLMIIGFAVLLVVVILYNLGSLNFVERMRDFATLRVLGFKKSSLRNITMYENILTTLIGWIIGIPMGFWFLNQYVRTFSTIHLEYTAHIGLLNLMIASMVVWICSLSTTFFVGRRIEKIDMVSALKSVD